MDVKKGMTNSNKATAFVYALFGFGAKQSKKQRVIIIVIHIMAWLAFFSLPLLFFNIRVTNNKFFLKEVINKLLLIAFFYFNYYYLIPVFFSRQKRKWYVIFLLASFVLLLAQEIFTEEYFFKSGPFFFYPAFIFKTRRHTSSRNHDECNFRKGQWHRTTVASNGSGKPACNSRNSNDVSFPFIYESFFYRFHNGFTWRVYPPCIFIF